MGAFFFENEEGIPGSHEEKCAEFYACDDADDVSAPSSSQSTCSACRRKLCLCRHAQAAAFHPCASPAPLSLVDEESAPSTTSPPSESSSSPRRRGEDLARRQVHNSPSGTPLLQNCCVFIVQHPKEAARSAISSIPVLRQVLGEDCCKIHVVRDGLGSRVAWREEPMRMRLSDAFERELFSGKVVVLYPGEDSMDVATAVRMVGGVESSSIKAPEQNSESTTERRSRSPPTPPFGGGFGRGGRVLSSGSGGDIIKTDSAKSSCGDEQKTDSAKSSSPPDEHVNQKIHLLAIDGSWGQARSIFQTLLQNYPILQTVPRVHVNLEQRQSIYEGLRNEPRSGFVSTLEAVALCLPDLEGNFGSHLAARLLDTFRRVVAEQKSFVGPDYVHHKVRRQQAALREKPAENLKSAENFKKWFADGPQPPSICRKRFYALVRDVRCHLTKKIRYELAEDLEETSFVEGERVLSSKSDVLVSSPSSSPRGGMGANERSPAGDHALDPSLHPFGVVDHAAASTSSAGPGVATSTLDPSLHPFGRNHVGAVVDHAPAGAATSTLDLSLHPFGFSDPVKFGTYGAVKYLCHLANVGRDRRHKLTVQPIGKVNMLDSDVSYARHVEDGRGMAYYAMFAANGAGKIGVGSEEWSSSAGERRAGEMLEEVFVNRQK